MDALFWIAVAIATPLALFSLRRHLPGALQAVWPGRFVKGSFLAGPDAATPERHDGELRDVLQRLVALGFTPLGAWVERILWHETATLALASERSRCFATLLDASGHCYFMTVLRPASAVLTRTYLGREELADDATVTSLETENLYRALQVHEEKVEEMVARGREPVVPSAATRGEAGALYYATSYGRRALRDFGRRSLFYAGRSLVILALIALTVALRLARP